MKWPEFGHCCGISRRCYLIDGANVDIPASVDTTLEKSGADSAQGMQQGFTSKGDSKPSRGCEPNPLSDYPPRVCDQFSTCSQHSSQSAWKSIPREFIVASILVRVAGFWGAGLKYHDRQLTLLWDLRSALRINFTLVPRKKKLTLKCAPQQLFFLSDHWFRASSTQVAANSISQFGLIWEETANFS